MLHEVFSNRSSTPSLSDRQIFTDFRQVDLVHPIVRGIGLRQCHLQI
jgi:hypothetical protein